MNTKVQHREREAATPPGRHPMTIGMAAAGLKKGLTHGGGCQTAKQLTALQAVTHAVLEDRSNHGTLGWH